jgi:hypothetical protein
MSLQFSDTTNLNGIVELIDANVGTNSTSYPLKQKARDVNQAALRLQMLAIQAEGRFQVDDTNHTKYPLITADLVSGQRDYYFLTDEQSNIILDIYKVMIKDPAGIWVELKPVDQQSPNSRMNPVREMLDGQDIGGTPDRYDKSWNSIFLEPIPNYNWRTANEGENGLKIWINREHSYFVSTDTTKVLGFGHAFHEYLALRPSYQYAYRKGLANKKDLQLEMIRMEEEIEEYFSKRARDEKTAIIPVYRSPR